MRTREARAKAVRRRRGVERRRRHPAEAEAEEWAGASSVGGSVKSVRGRQECAGASSARAGSVECRRGRQAWAEGGMGVRRAGVRSSGPGRGRRVLPGPSRRVSAMRCRWRRWSVSGGRQLRGRLFARLWWPSSSPGRCRRGGGVAWCEPASTPGPSSAGDVTDQQVVGWGETSKRGRRCQGGQGSCAGEWRRAETLTAWVEDGGVRC